MSARPGTYLSRGVLADSGSCMSLRCLGRKADVCAGGRREPPRSSAEGMVVVVVVEVVVVVVEEVVVEVVVVEVVVAVAVLAEAVAAVVVVLLGGSEVSGETEPEDDTEGTASAEPEVGRAGSSEPAVPTLGTGSACPVLGAADAEVVVASVVSGRATVPVVATPSTTASVVAVSGLLSPPPDEQAKPTSPKTAAKAATETNFACLIPKKPLIADGGFSYFNTQALNRIRSGAS